MLMSNMLAGLGGAVPTMRGTPTVASGNPGLTRTIAHTVDAANRNCLIVRSAFLDVGSGGDTTTGVAWNGTAMTLARGGVGGGGTKSCAVSIWYLVNPAVGTFNVVVTNSIDAETDYVRCENWQDVNPTTPIGGTALHAPTTSETVLTADVTKTKTLSLVLGVGLVDNTRTTTPGADITEEVDNSALGGANAATAWLAKNTVNGSMNLTWSGTGFSALAAAELNGDA